MVHWDREVDARGCERWGIAQWSRASRNRIAKVVNGGVYYNRYPIQSTDARES